MEEKKNLTLLIMAAGMGSRFGGLKQIEPIGPNGEFITDYSIYDAILAGVTKVVFVIKKESLEIFQNTIEKRIGNKIPIEYAFQESILKVEDEIYTREKPWGTAHAIDAAKDIIKENFIVINSDDFYGRDAFLEAAKFFDKERSENEFGLIGYKIANTLTENGSVKRGVCEVENGYLTQIIESKVNRENGTIIATPLSGEPDFEVEEDKPVSMNMFLFNPYIFKLIEKEYSTFIKENQDKLETAEYLIPDLIQKEITQKEIIIEVLNTTSKWEGVTYKEDKESVVCAIQEKIKRGEYKENLWQES